MLILFTICINELVLLLKQDVELVVVQLELEHHAVPKAKVLSDGFTHDWTIIVRGPDDCKIQEFVEKVVFNLHPDFPRCKRGQYSM